MKFLVLAACVAVSSAQLVTFPNGAVVPADTAEAAHFAAGGGVHAYPYGYAGYPYAVAGYPYGLVGHANGAVVPVDEPAVAAAKAAHFAAGGVIHPTAALAYAGYPYPYFGGLVAHPNGALVPLEPADVVEARAAHLKAFSEA